MNILNRLILQITLISIAKKKTERLIKLFLNKVTFVNKILTVSCNTFKLK
jgi:hypothetical protein